MSDDDFVMQLLVRLSLEYDVVVASINSSHDLVDVEATLSLLLSQETRLQQAVTEVNPQAHLTKSTKKKFEQEGQNRGQSQNNKGGGTRGKGQGRGRINNHVWCQLCGKPGHTCHKCWHCFDQSFQGPHNCKLCVL